jgi:signal transduction histidine kinase
LIGLIVQNLLGNAVKYSAKGTIRVRAVVKAGECMMSVSDEGPGIAVEHLDRIFDAFRGGEAHAQSGFRIGAYHCIPSGETSRWETFR